MTGVPLAASGHQLGDAPAPEPPPGPLTAVPQAPRRSPAEEARTIVAGAEAASLATISEDGSPWASLVAFSALEDGSPVLMVSTLAEHGRNLERDARASMVFALPVTGGDHLARGRVTLLGRAAQPDGALGRQAHESYLERMPAAKLYAGFGDFTTYVLQVDRVRWVGGYGTMDSATGEDYRAAEVDPIGDPAGAIAHLNEDHADALLDIARGLTGYTDAESARCTAIDRYGLDLAVATPRGAAPARAGWAEPLTGAEQLRAASVALVRRARAALSAV